MKFRLTTAGDYYSTEAAEALKVLGFDFEVLNEDCSVILDTEVFINFNSLQELVEFTEKWGELVFNDDSITIYDDYLE